MDHRRAPVLEAIDRFHTDGMASYALPGHRLGRGSYFAAHEDVTEPVGRISAEMVSPYPPGVPAVLPGERFNQAVVDYLRAGAAAGMALPDAADPQLKTFRVVS